MTPTIDTLNEFSLYQQFRSLFPKSESQLNDVNESDAEIFKLESQPAKIAVSTDMICEEIKAGIYTDPFLMGWMSVVVNVSDIHAVGAEPKYLVLNEVFSKDMGTDFIQEIQRGISEACSKFNVFVLGGDTNFSDETLLGGTCIGFIGSSKESVQRKGAAPGDLIYTGTTMGTGNFHAFTRHQNLPTVFDFRPYPNRELSKVMSTYASSCIDTSDGVFHSLYTLMKVNKVGVHLHKDAHYCIPEKLRGYCEAMTLSPYLLLAGIVGEYELLFTVPPNQKEAFLKEVKEKKLSVHGIGTIREEEKMTLTTDGEPISIDLDAIVHAFQASKGNMATYISILKNQLVF